MFEDSLMESGHKIKTQQGRYTTLSTLMVASVVGFMILLPLLVTQALPLHMMNALMVVPPPPPAPVHVQKVSEVVNGQLRAPTKIPKQVKMIEEEEAPPPTGVMGGVVGGVPGGQAGGVLGSIIGSAAPPPKVAAPKQLRVSQGVMDGQLKRRIEPTYPQMARIAHIQGDVILQARISKAGVIEDLHAVSGHPILVQAAMDAVRQWLYKPYELNGEPVEVETTIKVQFHM
ncbi:MAG TPA: energy transducer TonB [Candidatus Angelobacter sp.]|nr:energy transducer TonB [Candidatus Angelobacter sp.]